MYMVSCSVKYLTHIISTYTYTYVLCVQYTHIVEPLYKGQLVRQVLVWG